VSDPLDELARAGREAHAREAARRDREARKAELEADRRAWRATSRLRWFGGYTGGLVVG
jgi:hypothetical protein